MNLHSFEENKQIRSEKGIHFEDVMFTFTRSLRLVTLFYANAFMSFSAVTCGILVVFCFYIKFSCVFMFFQIKINHRFEPHRYHFHMVADPVRQHGPRGITIWFKICLEKKNYVFTIIVFFSVLKFVFFCFYFELLRYRRSSLRGVVAQDSPKDRHEIFDKMQRIFEQSSSRSFFKCLFFVSFSVDCQGILRNDH